MQPGDVIGDRFEIEQIAGVGGMGTVYRARERTTGHRVAVKVLHGGNPKDELRLVREARLLADLNHPSVVRYIGQGLTTSGAPFLVMEWLAGEDLNQRLMRRGLSVEESLILARHVAEALGAAHARGIIHRDIKPANVFLVGASVDDIRVLDFGIARSLRTTGIVTRTGALLGTLGYIAPEQARGGAQVDVRSDVFALGCILFECLTGRPAFAGDGAMAVLVKILFEQAPRMSDQRRDIPPVLDDLVARMLSKDPDERPQDALEVARELSRIHVTDALRGSSRRSRPPMLMDSELRLASVVVATVHAHPFELPTETPGEEVRTLGGENAVFADIAAAVTPFGAQIERLPEGSMAAILTAKGSASDQAVRAARAARAIRALLPEAAISLSTGRGLAQASLPLGEVIDRAIRLLSLGGPVAPPAPSSSRTGSRPIYIDAVTAGFLDARFEVTQDAAGRFELGGERSAIQDLSRRLLGRPTPCVGRERELGVLATYLEECLKEPMARAILVTSAPGMGKSRLGHEFLCKVRQEEPTAEIWIAQGTPMSAGSPLGLIGQLLRCATGVHDGEPLEVRRAKVRARIQRSLGDPRQARVTEFIGELAGVPFEANESVQLSSARSNPRLMNDQMRRAWCDLLTAECQAHPVILVLEDLHWGDLPSIQWLDAVLRDLQARPLFVLALGRPEVHERFSRLWTERGQQEIRLGELSRKAGERLARQVLGASVPRETIERVARQAGGNAFFLEELIRAVAEGKENAFPETVLAMVEVRLEELGPELRRVIRAASLFGERFWEGGLGALLGEDRSQEGIKSSLEQLADRELVRRSEESRLSGEREYLFRHAFVREAAYAMLTEHDRILGHRLVAEWLERVGEQDALVLAGHFERGQAVAEAAMFYERSAMQALDVSDLGAAIDRAERIVAGGAEGLQLGRARWIQAEAHHWRNELALAEQRIEEAMRLLPRHSPPWFSAVAEAVEIAFMQGNHERAVALFEELRPRDEGVPAQASQLIVLAAASETLLRMGQLAPALEFCPQLESAITTGTLGALGALRGIGGLGEAGSAPLVVGWVRKTLGMRDVTLGDPATAHATFLLAQEDFQRAGDVRQVEYMRLLVAMVDTRLGRCEEAEAGLREGEIGMYRLGVPALAYWALYNRAIALMTRGALHEALILSQENVANCRRHGNSSFLSKGLATLAAILLGMGRLEEAEAATLEALEGVGYTSTVKATMAEVLLVRGRPEAALPLAWEAMQLRQRMGLSLEEKEALAPLVLAEALHATGNLAGARTVIAAASEHLLDIAMRLPEAAWRQRFLAVPENARTLALAEAWGLGDQQSVHAR